MPDFIGGLAKGIENSRGLVQNAMKGVAADMTINPTATVNAQSAAAAAAGSAESSASSGFGTFNGPLIQIQEMTVRSQDDIRSISQQLDSQLTRSRRAMGYTT